ncbi:MAG: hypothetical protein NTX50_31470 [Candidatus Sumerlaeota bacterium]|nr:hypothetical protein [Candidatus Sumerlaeota bacterium]
MLNRLVMLLLCGALLNGCASPGLKAARIASLGPEPPAPFHAVIKVAGKLERDPLLREALATGARCAFIQASFANEQPEGPLAPQCLVTVTVESAEGSTSWFMVNEVPTYNTIVGYRDYIFDARMVIKYSATVEYPPGTVAARLVSRSAAGHASETSIRIPLPAFERNPAATNDYEPGARKAEAAGEAAKYAAMDVMKWARQVMAAQK